MTITQTIKHALSCIFQRHKYRPAYASRVGFRTDLRGKRVNPGMEVKYECVHCHAPTKWMTVREHEEWKKKNRPSWKN